MPQASQDNFEWGFDNLSVNCVFLITSFITRGRFVSEASHDRFEWGFDHPSVNCVFLYYRFYYKGTICVQVKPRPLWKRSWDPLRELCVSLLQVLLQGDDWRPSQAKATLEAVLGPPP